MLFFSVRMGIQQVAINCNDDVKGWGCLEHLWEERRKRNEEKKEGVTNHL